MVRVEYMALMIGFAIALTSYIVSNGQLLFWGILGGAAVAIAWLIMTRLMIHRGW